jgi:hypothetical protein
VKKTIIINFLIIFLFFLFAETSVRVLNLVELQGSDKEIFYIENDIIQNKPNSIFKVFGKKSKTDNNGFRIPNKKFSYSQNKNFTLILGDSVTFGVGVEEEESFIGILRKKKQENLLNTAIIGHNIKSYSYILEKNYKIFNKKIDKVIIFLCLNDIVSYQGVKSKTNLDNSIVEKNFIEYYLKNDFLLKVNVFLREKSAFFVLLKSVVTNPVKRHYEYMNVLYEDEENLILFQSYIDKIIQFSKYNNLDVEFVLLPYTYQIINNCKKELLRPQNEIKKIFVSLNFKLNDYTKNFCNNVKNKDLFLPYDPVHLSKYGHQHVSNLIIEKNILDK